MSKFSIDSLWKPNQKATLAPAPVAELQRMEAEWSEKRSSLLAEHEELSNGMLTAFESGGIAKVNQSQQRIREIEGELQICDLKRESLKGSIEEAKAREDHEKLKAKGAEARAANKLLRDDLLEIHKMAVAMATVLQRAADRENEIRKFNDFFRSANVKHLLVTDPINALIQKIGPLQVSASQVAKMADVPNPVRSFHLPGYWPQGPWAKTAFGGEEHYIGRLSEIEI